MNFYFDGVMTFGCLVLFRALVVDQVPPIVAYKTAVFYGVFWPICVPFEILAFFVRVFRRF